MASFLKHHAAAVALMVACVSGPTGKSGVLAQNAQPPVWTVNAAQSSLGFTTRWAGSPVAGTFTNWTADIRFDSLNLRASRVRVVVQTAAIRSGRKEVVDNLPGTDWLSSRAFLTATFEANTFTALGGNRYRADGILTLRGASHRLSLLFTLDTNVAVATMNGAAALNRLPLGIGVDSDSSAEWVDRVTTLNVRVMATRR